MQVNERLPKRGGRKPEWQEKNPDNQPENRYRVGLSEVKIHRPNREWNPGPSNIGDKFAWSEIRVSGEAQALSLRLFWKGNCISNLLF